jgi:hypothetical protein
MKNVLVFTILILSSVIVSAQSTPAAPTRISGFPYNGYCLADGAEYNFSVGSTSANIAYEWVVRGGAIVAVEEFGIKGKSIIVKTVKVEGFNYKYSISSIRYNYNTHAIQVDTYINGTTPITTEDVPFNISVRAVNTITGACSNYLNLSGFVVFGNGMAE